MKLEFKHSQPKIILKNQNILEFLKEQIQTLGLC